MPTPPGFREKRQSGEHARTRFDQAADRSAFYRAFMAMQDGQGGAAAVLAILDGISPSEPGKYMAEARGIKKASHTLVKKTNGAVAEFLRQAAARIPTLSDALAGEIIYALGEAAKNRETRPLVAEIVGGLLQDASVLSPVKQSRLRMLATALEKPLPAEEPAAASDEEPTAGGGQPPVQTARRPVLMTMTGAAIATPTEGELRFGKRLTVGLVAAAALAIALGVFYHVRMLGSGEKKAGPPPKAQVVAPVAAPQPAVEEPVPEARPAEAKAVETGESSPNIIIKKKIKMKRRPAPVVKPHVAVIAEPLRVIAPDAGVAEEEKVAGEIAAAPFEEAGKRMTAMISADAGAGGEFVAGVLGKVAVTARDDDVAVFAIGGLRQLSAQPGDAGAPVAARAVLQGLASDAVIVANPRRSLALQNGEGK